MIGHRDMIAAHIAFVMSAELGFSPADGIHIRLRLRASSGL